MSEPRPFNEIKLQWLALLSQDKTLSSTAIVVALYIITVHYNQDRGKAWPSYQTIANATGRNAKTVQRAVKELEAGWLQVRRGNGLGHSTEFAPSQNSIIAATNLREKKDNIVTLHPTKGGHKRPQRVTNSSPEGRQNCPPNTVKESRYEKRAREAPRRPKSFSRLFVERGSSQAQAWSMWLTKVGLQCLKKLLPVTTRFNLRGYDLPGRFPPADPTKWPETIEHLQTLHHHHAAKLAA